MKEIPKVPVTLMLCLIFLLLAAWKPFQTKILFNFIGFLVILIILYFDSKKTEDRYDRNLLLGLLGVSILVFLIFKEIDQVTLTLRIGAISAYVLLHGVLLIGPWSRFSTRILKFYFYRRHLGVSVLLLGLLHVALVFSTYFNFSIKDALQSIFIFYGSAALLLLTWLGLSSWDVLQKRVKPLMWKVLHAILLVVFLAEGFYAVSVQEELASLHYAMIGLMTLFWLVVAPYGGVKKIMRTYIFGWKQLHVLIWVIYVSLILHVWFGWISFNTMIYKVVFWLLVLLVVGSHAYGWFTRYIEDKKILSRIRKIGKAEDGFVGVDYVKNFVGKGRKSYVDGLPVAIFKNGDEFIAVGDTCAHQKGPLHLGRLINDCIECPWHYWIYNSEGKYLGKEGFSVAKYSVRVKDGIVFVKKVSDEVNSFHP
tara:strand:- start:930 stop:2198 length:1269 start_codon:yes stop_codon:yes gene_type:complete